MSNPEQDLIDQWLREGRHARVVRYVATRSRLFPKLYLYKAGVRAATILRDHEQLERFAEQARMHFPDSSLGYVAGARVLLQRSEPNAARRLLQAAENQHGTDPELRVASDDVLNALGSLEVRASKSTHTNGSAEPQGLDALRGAYDAAARRGRWEEAKDWAQKVVTRYPEVAFGPIGIAHALHRLDRPEAARALLENLPASSPIERAFLLADIQRDAGDDMAALRTLITAQRHHAGDRRLLLRLADLYRDDGQKERAHAFLEVAARIHPDYGSVRCLTFESDVGWFDLGEVTLERVLAMEPSKLLRFMGMVNRVAPFYPQQREALAAARAYVRKELWHKPVAAQKGLDTAVELALKNRWLTDLRELLSASAAKGIKPSNDVTQRVDQLLAGLGPFAELVELGWHNEHADRLLAVSANGITPIEDSLVASERVVELFIPTPFFAYDDTEKPTYDVVRETLRTVAETLLSRHELMIVPRLQLNWRHVSRRLSGRALSYHTHAERNPHWLHIQETPLAGTCSFDNQGFAGFSSIAADFQAIEHATAHLSEAELAANFASLRARYVEKNVSKYKQAAHNEPLPERFVFVPMQVSTDIVADLAYIDADTMLETVANHFHGTNTQVVVKRHPYCRSFRVQALLRKLAASGHIVLTNNSVHDLLAQCERVITVNSGVGLEALLHGKNVITTGKCDYAYASQMATSVEQLRSLLGQAPVDDSRKAERLLWFYWNRYVASANDKAAVVKRIDEWLGA